MEWGSSTGSALDAQEAMAAAHEKDGSRRRLQKTTSREPDRKPTPA